MGPAVPIDSHPSKRSGVTDNMQPRNPNTRPGSTDVATRNFGLVGPVSCASVTEAPIGAGHDASHVIRQGASRRATSAHRQW